MSYILDGKYYPNDKKITLAKTNSQYKNWNHDRQREDHRADIIQAHKNGKPNPQFIQQYPEAAKEYFNDEEIRRYGNG